MATNEPTTTIWEKLQAIDRRILYLILIVVVSMFIIFPFDLPNDPLPQSRALYDAVNGLPNGSPIIIASEWTMSSRGENIYQFKSLVRLCMLKQHKIVLMTISEPAAVGFALGAFQDVNNEPGHKRYAEGTDFVNIGYRPNGDAFIQSMAADLSGTLGQVQVLGQPANRLEMLKDIHSLRDIKIIVDVTASSTNNSFMAFTGGLTEYGLMCTGVMFPEALPYVATGQIVGVANGARGAYDFETMMKHDYPDATKNVKGAKAYMTPLTGAMALLMTAIVVGNIAMGQARKTREREA
jgi:hypothetical protein